MDKSNMPIRLTEAHRGGAKSTLFTGRPEGRRVREELKLDSKDQENLVYDVYIPKGTTSINSSFFLGLFYNSILKLGSVECFKEKYPIDLSEVEEELRPYLESNLKECYRKAENEINHSTGLD